MNRPSILVCGTKVAIRQLCIQERITSAQSFFGEYRAFFGILFLHLFPWLWSTSAAFSAEPSTIRIGSKSFTESVILGEMLTSLARHAGAKAEHRAELGGTQILWKALVGGEIDAYVEYTGTLSQEILQDQGLNELSAMRASLANKGIHISEPLGFNNTYALGMRKQRAVSLGIAKISDLKSKTKFKLGFSDEFMERGDGWYGLRQQYAIPDFQVRGLDHSLAYRGLVAGSIDVIDLYSTDPEIVSYDLKVLEDDLAYFPMYQAVVVYRADLARHAPAVVDQFSRLEGKIDSQTMAQLNKNSRIDKRPETLIAVEFLNQAVDKSIPVPDEHESLFQRRFKKFLSNSLEHLILVAVSLSLAIVVAIPLGICAHKIPRASQWILGVVGIVQTIPSMALLVFMIPLLGLGAAPAIVALFLYSLLPIVRGTFTGLQGLPGSMHESALALGLPDGARLRLIELPLASQSILSGIKTSAVINVGTATIGALIGAGGYGQPILTGIRLADLGLILQGAVPAALLAVLVQSGFGYLENWLVPKGLRMPAGK